MAKHEKLLERMRQSRNGWGQDDFRALYVGYGFSVTEGGNHMKIAHLRHSQLRTTVARHNHLPRGYADTALRLIELLLELESQPEG